MQTDFWTSSNLFAIKFHLDPGKLSGWCSRKLRKKETEYKQSKTYPQNISENSVLSVYYPCFSYVILLHQKDTRPNNIYAGSFSSLGYINWFLQDILCRYGWKIVSVQMQTEGWYLLLLLLVCLFIYFPEETALAESGCGGAKILRRKERS